MNEPRRPQPLHDTRMPSSGQYDARLRQVGYPAPQYAMPYQPSGTSPTTPAPAPTPRATARAIAPVVDPSQALPPQRSTPASRMEVDPRWLVGKYLLINGSYVRVQSYDGARLRMQPLPKAPPSQPCYQLMPDGSLYAFRTPALQIDSRGVWSNVAIGAAAGAVSGGPVGAVTYGAVSGLVDVGFQHWYGRNPRNAAVGTAAVNGWALLRTLSRAANSNIPRTPSHFA